MNCQSVCCCASGHFVCKLSQLVNNSVSVTANELFLERRQAQSHSQLESWLELIHQYIKDANCMALCIEECSCHERWARHKPSHCPFVVSSLRFGSETFILLASTLQLWLFASAALGVGWRECDNTSTVGHHVRSGPHGSKCF